jgi:hypothetical protein
MSHKVDMTLASLRARFMHQRGTMRETFEGWDADASGAIDAEELQAALTMLGHNLTRQEARLMVERFDGNGDSSVQYDEFVSALCGPEAGTAQPLPEAEAGFLAAARDPAQQYTLAQARLRAELPPLRSTEWSGLRVARPRQVSHLADLAKGSASVVGVATGRIERGGTSVEAGLDTGASLPDRWARQPGGELTTQGAGACDDALAALLPPLAMGELGAQAAHRGAGAAAAARGEARLSMTGRPHLPMALLAAEKQRAGLAAGHAGTAASRHSHMSPIRAGAAGACAEVAAVSEADEAPASEAAAVSEADEAPASAAEALRSKRLARLQRMSGVGGVGGGGGAVVDGGGGGGIGNAAPYERTFNRARYHNASTPHLLAPPPGMVTDHTLRDDAAVAELAMGGLGRYVTAAALAASGQRDPGLLVSAVVRADKLANVRSQLVAWETAVTARVAAEQAMVLADIAQRVERKQAERAAYTTGLVARKAACESAMFAPHGPTHTSVL